MPTFRNISDRVFVDGNITVLPNQVWTVDDPTRVEQLTNQYGWQFENTDAPQGAQSAAEPASPRKSLSKMNRAELKTLAAQLGVTAAEYDTNRNLIEAIKTRQTAK